MRSAVILVALAAGTALAQEAGTPAEKRAFVEVELLRETCFVEETVRVRLRVGLDAAYFRSNAVPMFRREIDVPARIVAPWLGSLAGADVLRGEPLAAVDPRPRRSIAVNDEVVAAARADDRTIDGRVFTVLEIERTIVPAGPGDLELAAPVLHFAYATQFDDDFVRGRTASDRCEASVAGTTRKLEVRALPQAGRPPEFTGAVGRFSVKAGAGASAVTAGESFRLALTIEGEGNLGRFPAPRLDGLGGFHVFGAIDDKGAARRTIAYDLAALGPEVKAVPAIRFAFFDPEPPGAYRTVVTPPIPLSVRPAPGAGAAPVPAAPDGPESSTELTAIVSVVAVGLVAVAFVVRRRARRHERMDADSVRADCAAAAFRARASGPGADLEEAFAEFLAARLRCPAAAVIAPDLPARLAAAGVSDGLAARAAALLERRVAARYGGGESRESDVPAADALVGELDAAFRAAAAR